jgi:hypothetical protein
MAAYVLGTADDLAALGVPAVIDGTVVVGGVVVVELARNLEKGLDGRRIRAGCRRRLPSGGARASAAGQTGDAERQERGGGEAARVAAA